MSKHDELLKTLWENINLYMGERWIDHEIRDSERDPVAPFADTGAALKRLLASGASRRDLSLICRHAAYSTAFQTLVDLTEHRFDTQDFGSLYEMLLSSDPSGLDGRPGSAPPPKPPISEFAD
jgi:hypothetical protein